MYLIGEAMVSDNAMVASILLENVKINASNMNQRM